MNLLIIAMNVFVYIMFALAVLACGGPSRVLPNTPSNASGTTSTASVNVAGPQGPSGLNGQNGTSCSIAQVSGGANITCGANTVFVANGAQGAQGVAGNNGTSITVVQLCSCTPSYPNVFPETALCINDQLYGVYSANDGFLALLTPGTYSSNGIDCSCTLTIEANCKVTN